MNEAPEEVGWNVYNFLFAYLFEQQLLQNEISEKVKENETLQEAISKLEQVSICCTSDALIIHVMHVKCISNSFLLSCTITFI